MLSASLVLLLLISPWPPAATAAEPRAAPLYALAPDGAWVEYDWKATGPDDKQLTGILRISSVGEKEIGRITYRCVEITKEFKQGDEVRRQSRKLLVDEKAFRGGQPLSDCVAEVFNKEGPGNVVTRLSPRHSREFLGMGFEKAGATLNEVRAKERVETGLGRFETRHVSARTEGTGRSREYHGWLTDEVAFGWAKVEIREQTGAGSPRLIFTAAAARRGRDARSGVDEARAK
jgi:hypothetical protein